MGVIVVLYVELGLVLHCTDEYLGTNRCRSVVKKNKQQLLFAFVSVSSAERHKTNMKC